MRGNLLIRIFNPSIRPEAIVAARWWIRWLDDAARALVEQQRQHGQMQDPAMGVPILMPDPPTSIQNAVFAQQLAEHLSRSRSDRLTVNGSWPNEFVTAAERLGWPLALVKPPTQIRMEFRPDGLWLSDHGVAWRPLWPGPLRRLIRRFRAGRAS